MSPVRAAEPVRAGVFQDTPFVQLLLELGSGGFSGTLVAQYSGRELKVLLRAGRPVAAGPLERGASLEQGLMPLCAVTTGTFRLYAEDLVGQAPGFTRGSFDPVVFLRGALREQIAQSVIDSVLEAHAGQALRLSPGVEARALGLHGREAQLVERLRAGAQTVASLTCEGALPEAWARRVVYFLLVTGTAVPQGPARSSGSSHLRMRAVSGASTPATVPPLASGSAPPAGGRSSAPPSRTGTSSAPAGPASAWQQLAARRASSAPPVTPSRAPSGPVSFSADNPEQEVERLLRMRDVAGALQLARRGVAVRPDSAVAHALLAWALLQGDPSGPVSPELVEAVNRALRLDPEQPRALYAKAMAYRRMGRELDALRYFQRTVRADPQHIDARRELRLAQMRGTIPKPTKKR
jgi:hypothetical protein